MTHSETCVADMRKPAKGAMQLGRYHYLHCARRHAVRQRGCEGSLQDRLPRCSVGRVVHNGTTANYPQSDARALIQTEAGPGAERKNGIRTLARIKNTGWPIEEGVHHSVHEAFDPPTKAVDAFDLQPQLRGDAPRA